MFMHKMKKSIIVLTLGTLPFAQANSITGAGRLSLIQFM